MSAICIQPAAVHSGPSPTPDPRAKGSTPDALLIERVNRLYHERTADRFDADHKARHRVEAGFWRWVGRTILEKRVVADVPSRLILDIGCGSGFVLNHLARFFSPGDLFLGVDLSVSSMLRGRGKSPAAKCLSSRITWSVGSGTRLPLPRRCADLVTINASLHHFADPAAMLREVDRVLKPRGHVAIGFEPNSLHFQQSILPGVGRTLDRIRWYSSPAQNGQRLRRILFSVRPDERSADVLLARGIARQLVMEGLCREELPACAILDLVDVHARGKNHAKGLSFDELFSAALPTYEPVRIFTSDYLGASARALRPLRWIADGVGRVIDNRAGSLISGVLRKPEDAS